MPDYHAHGVLEAQDGALVGAIDLADGRRRSMTCAVTEPGSTSEPTYLLW